MYIRKSKRRHRGKVYTSYSLVESYRTENGPRQRTICSLGELKARSRKNWLKLIHKVEDKLVGQKTGWKVKMIHKSMPSFMGSKPHVRPLLGKEPVSPQGAKTMWSVCISTVCARKSTVKRVTCM